MANGDDHIILLDQILIILVGQLVRNLGAARIAQPFTGGGQFVKNNLIAKDDIQRWASTTTYAKEPGGKPEWRSASVVSFLNRRSARQSQAVTLSASAN